jgi:hypothetical protein
MQHEPENLNTESNDIAGNRIDGPVGNTATQHTAPGAGVGQPGGVPNSANAAQPTVPVSSEALAAAETSPAQGAVDGDGTTQENKEADPATLTPGSATYGGNFSNSTQDSYHDQRRRDNQDSDADRGEFGVESQQGTTHGGFGNQNRVADYEPRNSAEDRYYGGPGAPGVQDNSYRNYDGHDARPDARPEYGVERGTAPDAATPPATANAAGAHHNDNGAPQGPDSGFAPDYGHTSLPGAGTGSQPAQPLAGHRNQTEDYLPTPGADAAPGRAAAPVAADEQGRNEPNEAPDYQTGGDRNGYTQPQANKGDSSQGIGSRGGSYNDAYDDSKPGSNAGSPAAGDQRREDTAGNYGSAAREENRASEEENQVDHGAPRRNEGRE